MTQIIVQHHPARAHLLDGLRATLGEITVVTDPDPDGKFRSPLRCYLECLRAIDDEHALIIQDDGRPCAHLTEVLPTLVEAKPDALLPLFVQGAPPANRNAMLQAMKTGGRWACLTPHAWCPVVATVWPAELARLFLVWAADKKWPRYYRSDDGAVGEWVKRKRVAVWAPVPCLVDHDDSEPSLIRPPERLWVGRRDRVAAIFIGDRDPREIDWSG